MKAVVLHEYGPPSKLKYEDFPDPKPGPGEVLIAVRAASINPIDWKMRSGVAKDHFPVTFPGILGRDVAGLVRELGEGVKDFAVGDRVFALAWATYAELCVVKAADPRKNPRRPRHDHGLHGPARLLHRRPAHPQRHCSAARPDHPPYGRRRQRWPLCALLRRAGDRREGHRRRAQEPDRRGESHSVPSKPSISATTPRSRSSARSTALPTQSVAMSRQSSSAR